MERELGFVSFRPAAAFHDVVVRALCQAEWSNRHFSRVFENFGVDQGNLVTGGAAGFDPQATHEVLPKVYHCLPGWGCQDFYGA